jgi:chromate reductase, NAD(P)H dehydrogenase (quinone)
MLLGIAGALRAESTNRKLLREAARLYGGPFAEADIRMPLFDEDLEIAKGIPPEAQRLFDQVAAAEAVVISSPEYNKSIPGGLKNALDWVSRIKGNPWKEKPLAIIGAADGREGGARASFALRLAMTPFRPRMLTGPEVQVASSRQAFDAEGRLIDARYVKALSTLMEDLHHEVRRGTEPLSRTA